MNSSITDRNPFEVDNRERYRQRLIASQRASRGLRSYRDYTWPQLPPEKRRYITDIRWDEPIGLWTILGWSLFAVVAILVIVEIIGAGLRAIQ